MEVDYLKQIINQNGTGKEYLKSEIDRLSTKLFKREDYAEGIHTFARLEGNRRGWEEITI